MLELLGTCVLVYFIFRLLDWIFRSTQKQHSNRIMVQDHTTGYWYLCEEREPDTLPEQLPPNVVRFTDHG